MTVTICEYMPTSHAKHAFKLCVKSSLSNIVLTTDYLNKIDGMLRMLGIQLTPFTESSIKYHRNYNGGLECIQTIYFIKEG